MGINSSNSNRTVRPSTSKSRKSDARLSFCESKPNRQSANFQPKYILGIIDPQNDFFQSGALAVPNSNEILGPINKLRFMLKDKVDTFISMDSHPSSHISFASTHKAQLFSKVDLRIMMNDNNIVTVEQTMWPTHCVIDTPGQQIHSDLITFESDIKIKKGTMEKIESYSAFGDEFANKYENTGLHAILAQRKITDIILVGLATDYCVYYTALDALTYGYSVHLILSCVRGVSKETTEKALEDLRKNKIKIYPEVNDFLRTIF